MKPFKFVGAFINELLKSGIHKLIGKGYSYVVLSLISDGLLRLGSMLR